MDYKASILFSISYASNITISISASAPPPLQKLDELNKIQQRNTMILSSDFDGETYNYHRSEVDIYRSIVLSQKSGTGEVQHSLEFPLIKHFDFNQKHRAHRTMIGKV